MVVCGEVCRFKSVGLQVCRGRGPLVFSFFYI